MTTYPNASRLTLFAACVYELLLLVALWMLSTWLFVAAFGDAATGYKRYLLQLFLWLIAGVYFVWYWCKSGQTLATQTWKIKLVSQSNDNMQNNTLNLKQACFRYALASACLLACGLGYFWALIDKNGLFLHDRLLKTRFIKLT